MQRTLARGGRLVPAFAVWLLVGGLLTVLLVAGRGTAWSDALLFAYPLSAVYVFVCLSSWYVARSVPLGRTGVLRVTVTAGLAALLSSAAWVGLARVWGHVLSRRLTLVDPGILAGAEAFIFSFGLLVYLLSLAVSYLFATFEQSRAADRRSLEALVLAREAELRSLRAQIDPHFLFNSLHSISALTVADPPGARRMCLLLADFLRDSLTRGTEAQIPLSREIDLASRFLAIERVRFGDRLRVDFDVADAGTCLVPPLVLQPLVENAVTHGIAHLLPGGTIRVEARRSPARLFITITNPCDRDRPPRAGGGVGLANVRGRLRALHGDDARVDAVEAEGTWRVDVTMPAVTAPGDNA